MASLFRAAVMLATLAGGGWALVEFGPPEKVQPLAGGAIEFIDGILGPATETPTVPTVTSPRVLPLTLSRDVSREISGPDKQVATTAVVGGEEASKLFARIEDAHSPTSVAPPDARAQLRQLGAADLQIEPWGQQQRLHRASCTLPIGDTGAVQHFDSIGPNSTAAAHQLLAQIEQRRLPPE